MDGNVRPHRTRVVIQYLERKENHCPNGNVCTFTWPKPSRTYMEHAPGRLSRPLAQPQAQTYKNVTTPLMKSEITSQIAQIRELIDSMNRRYRAVINARGGHTRYSH